MRKLAQLAFFLMLVSGSLILAQTFGTKKRTPKPHEYGTVEINNHSTRAGEKAVVFPHWLHRAKYTCRLCHIDLGFAMTAGETNILEEDNTNGLYCGACHNGEIAFGPEEQGVSDAKVRNCVRCHSSGKKVEFDNNFYTFTKGFPRSRFGNKVDWMVAEDKGLIRLVDYLEGVSIKRKPLTTPQDIEIRPFEFEIPNVLFSHEKHAVWNGCELCHPQIFGIKTGASNYDMQDVFDGKYCGACHGSVAFANTDCQLCHTGEVQ